MVRPYLVLLIIHCCLRVSAQFQMPVGQWRHHLPLRQVVDIASDGNGIMVATRFGFYRYDPLSREIIRISSSNGLSDVRIAMFAKDPASSESLIAYANGNIDLIRGSEITNIPDIMRSGLQAAKNIYNGYWNNNNVYLSTGAGIIVVNTAKDEIKETIRTNPNGVAEAVYQLSISGGQIYAATAGGLKKANFPNPLLSDPLQWSQEIIPMTGGTIDQVLSWSDRLVVRKRDSLFIREGSNWRWFHSTPSSITFVRVNNGKLLVGYAQNNKGNLLVFNDPQSAPQLISPRASSSPVAAIWETGRTWLGDASRGLISMSGNTEEIIIPASPHDIATGRSVFAGGKVLASAGDIVPAGIPASKMAGVFSYDGNNWVNYEPMAMPALDTMPDITTIAVDPSSQVIWAGSFGGGMIEIPNAGAPRIYKYNSFIAAAVSDPRSFRVTGLAFDQQRNLWITNHGAANPLLVRKADGTTTRYALPLPNTGNALMDIMIDDANRKWILGGPGNGLICFDDNGTPDQLNDDRWRLFSQGRGNGNLPSTHVLSVANDKNGFIWVGTDRGIALIQCGDDLFRSGLCEAVLPVVEQNNVAGLLLANEQINDIKVDGADRKWIATNNGVWLLSADGQKTIERFTRSSGKLLSNIVRSITIHPLTGEVFFFTADGICSFSGTATEAVPSRQKPFVFPNPVPPGYNGTIVIRNLPANAWVRIVELDGKLVFQSRSLGGQAIWNGKNYKGERPSSGAYLIYVGDEFNQQQVAGKIFFIK